MSARITPNDSKGINFMGSEWQNSETEQIASNIVYIQVEMDPAKWTPFTFEDYSKHCNHSATESERVVLEALVIGGKPVILTTAHLRRGYLSKEGDKYMVTDKFINVILSCIQTT